MQKPLHIRFKKMDGFIKNYDEIRYLVLFGPGPGYLVQDDTH